MLPRLSIRSCRPVVLLLLALALPARARDWSDLARRFTGESEQVRQDAISRLRKDPHLEETLRKELQGPNRFLALDVISALKLKNLLPDLIQASEHDESGFFYNALNALITSENQESIVALYRERVLGKRTPPAAKVVLLDSLGRLGARLKRANIEKLLDDSSPDVRSAALYFVRTSLLKLGDIDFISFIDTALKRDPYQLRLQALALFSELPRGLRIENARYLSGCLNDPVPLVQETCRKVAGGGT